MRLSINDLLPDTLYAVQVRAVGTNTVSEWSPRFEFVTESDTVAPLAPTGVTWVVSGDSFHAEWDTVTTNIDLEVIPITRYEVELIADGITRIVSVVPTTDSGKVTYDLSFEQNRALFTTPQATVDLRVRAVDNKELKSAWSSPGLSATNPPPAAVTGLAATELYDSISLSWDASTDTDLLGYSVHVSTDSTNGIDGTFSEVGRPNTPEFIHSTTQFASDHWYKVFAVDKFGTLSATATAVGPVSPKTGFEVDTTPPTFAGPVAVTTGWDSAVQSSHIDVSWTASPDTDLDGYEVRWGATLGSNWRYRRVGRDVTSSRIDGLQSGISYYVSVRAIDFAGNASAFVNATEYPITTNFDTSGPSKPAAPTVSATVDALKLQVNHNGQKASGGAMETDTDYFRVHASRTSGFAHGQTNLIGTLKYGNAASAVFMVPAEAVSETDTTDNWYVRIVPVDKSGNWGTVSDEVAATVGLIETANIGFAQITDAKISDLTVDKLTAGTGLATDFTIKSTLTLGESGNDGVIQSYDYSTSSGTEGFSLDSDGLIIKTGTIEAEAINLQVGSNIAHPKFADFEWQADSYPAPFDTSDPTNFTANISLEQSKFGDTSLKLVNTSGLSRTVYIGESLTDYNVYLEAEQKYIISCYVYNASAAVVSGTIGIKFDNAAEVTSAESFADIAGWTRYSAVIDAPIGVTKGLFRLEMNDGTLYVDGLQIEKAVNSQVVDPSAWAAPGSTTVSGSSIRTGEIRSNTTLDINGVILPTWQIDVEGAAQFGDMLIRGDTIVGTDDDEADGSHIKSFNYLEGEQGWIVRADGYAEFRQMAADSIDGHAIKADSLEVNRLSSGNMDASIELLGAISAHGVLGEEVSMSADGFSVYGPDEVNVTNKALTSNVATLTTSTAHGMSVGSPIIVQGVGAPFDGQYEASAVTSTTVSYALTASDVSSIAADGILKGKDATGTNVGPRYIHFPTDGTQPNIISGKLSADSLVVQQGASLRGETVIEQGAAIVISHKQTPPKSSPVVSFNYSDSEIGGMVFNKQDMTFGHNGSLFLLNNDDSGNAWKIYEFNPNSSSKVATEVFSESVSYPLNIAVHGITYFNNKYYVSLSSGNSKAPATEHIRVYDTTFTQIGEVGEDVLGPDWPDSPLLSDEKLTPSGWTDNRLGWDYTNNRLIVAWVDGGSTSIKVRYYTIDGSGIPTGPDGAEVTLPSTTNATEVAGVVRGSLDFGADRLVVRNQGAGSGTVRSRVMVFNSSHAYQSSESWPFAYSQPSKGFDWNPGNSRFYDISPGNLLKEYFAGDSVWTSGNGDRWLSYTWYRSANSDSDGSNSAYETTPGPAVKVYLPKRARIQVTTSPIPKGPTNSEQTPNMARVYVSNSTSNTAPATSDSSWHLRSEIMHPATSVNVDPNGVLTDPGPPTTNGFLALGGDDPAQITSSSGDTYWRGDGEAKMFKLILTSTSDVNASAGNEPPLRIGDITATHTRFDGNEIQGMVGDATPGLLGLNHSGGAVTINGGAEGSITLGFNSRSFKRIAFGHHNTNSNASGLTTTNHGLGATPTLVLCTPTGAGVTRAIMWRPGTTDSTSFEAEHASLADGTYLTNTAVDFSWVAVVL